MTDPEGTVTTYAYDEVSRLTGMTTPHGVYSLTYDTAGRRLSLTHPNGMAARYSYDDANRLLEVINEHPTTGVVAKAQYTYDANGNPVTKTDTQGTTTYQYDETDQLVGESGSGKSLQWQYDPVGNRLQETRNGQVSTSTYDDANQLLTRSDGTTWTYDANGNMASETGPGGATTYSFDVENRLTRVQKGTDVWQYVYGPAHERIKRIAPDGDTDYQLDGPDVLAEYDPQGALVARNVHTLSVDDILSRSMGGQAYHYAVDGLGSVQALTAADGSVAANYQYEGFGKVTETGGVPNPYKFTGREDEGNGLYFYRARFFSPAIGRFVSRDPIGFAGGDSNLYRYVWNQPSSYLDPFGLAGAGATWGDAPGKGCSCPNEGLKEAAKKLAGIAANALKKTALGACLLIGGDTPQDPDANPDSGQGEGAHPGPQFPVPPLPDNPANPPSPDWTWKGGGPPGSKDGNWVNDKTGEKLHPDIKHDEPKGPHWGWKDPSGKSWDIDLKGNIRPGNMR